MSVLANRQIIIEQENGLWAVREGDRYQDKLSWDECLGVFATLIVPPVAGGYCVLRTAEEHEAQRATWQKKAPPLEPWQKQVEACARCPF